MCGRPSTRGQDQGGIPSTHTVQSVDPAAPEYVPFGHGRQIPLPASGLYWPGLHGEHALPSAPVCPARHVQSLKSVLPSPELELAGHALHCEAWVAGFRV